MEFIYTSEAPSAQQIYELYEALDWNSFLGLSPEQLYTAMKQSWYVQYVFDDNRLIGTGRAVSDGVINAYLCGLGVHPAYRNKGIGTEISSRLVAHCKKSNLHIQFFCKDSLVPYYEGMGFKAFAVGMKAE